MIIKIIFFLLIFNLNLFAQEHSINFVCTGNYYRSRYAEAVFNHLAKINHLNWKATSRGLDTSKPHQPLEISPLVIKELQKNHIPFSKPRTPIAQTAEDFKKAERTVVMSEEEHRPMMQKKFPEYENKVEYLHFPDIVDKDLLPGIYREVEKIIKNLQKK